MQEGMQYPQFAKQRVKVSGLSLNLRVIKVSNVNKCFKGLKSFQVVIDKNKELHAGMKIQMEEGGKQNWGGKTNQSEGEVKREGKGTERRERKRWKRKKKEREKRSRRRDRELELIQKIKVLEERIGGSEKKKKPRKRRRHTRGCNEANRYTILTIEEVFFKKNRKQNEEIEDVKRIK